ncbi:hypothetical protein L1987_34638 [Smallanthus sonchifolius]|uniref:Uncharacterized protein n=1 Tax=Smallanthus sonchifolius TaxID=185202 RepID=A0ACB9HVT3_9ASTR|nr:hypothetical protein L1987_34638 [Smallanthus sonchifolius]
MVETDSSSCSGGGGDGNSTQDGGCIPSYHKTIQSPSPTISPEEEEDMANCLIMLAQNVSVSPFKEEKSDIHPKMKKLKIRSVTEMAATAGGGNSGFQSYECKTCNRAFPSFQALGGHRSSHKKPKLTVDNTKPEFSKEDQLPQLLVVYEEEKNITTKPLDFIQTGYKNNKAKVHECSICGSEFLSGQALGGHMRRHRTPPPSISPTKAKLSPEVIEKSPVLSLDLNLPPPEVVDDGHSSFQFTASSSQQPLLFSAAALVDCHY